MDFYEYLNEPFCLIFFQNPFQQKVEKYDQTFVNTKCIVIAYCNKTIIVNVML